MSLNDREADIADHFQSAGLTRYDASSQNMGEAIRRRDFITGIAGSSVASKADVTLLNFDVRYYPESGHSSTLFRCLLWGQ
jgi:hypothetical protein